MILDSLILIEKGELSRRETAKLLKSLTFLDAEGDEVFCYDYADRGLRIPRGAKSLLPKRGYHVADLRSRPKMPKLSHTAYGIKSGDWDWQLEAVATMLAYEQGQVIAPPGAGKTNVGVAFAAACKTPTLVVVHTKDLYQQWVDRIESLTNTKAGKIQGNTCQVEHITVAMVQTLRKYIGAGKTFWRQFGCLIIDEAHHSAAEQWEWVLNVCPAFYRFGLSATEKRADQRQPLVKFLVGPIIYKVPFKSKVPITVVPIETKFKGIYRGSYDWQYLLRQIVNDSQRNRIIANRVRQQIREGHTVLVLSRQIKHLENIWTELGPEANYARVITGRLPRPMRTALINKMRAGEIKCVLSTQLFDEGVDVPRISRIHLTFPGKHEGRIVQQIGRGIREHESKIDLEISDYVDDFIVKLGEQYRERKVAYKKMGIKVRKAVRQNEKGKKRVGKKGGRELLDSLRIRRRGRD